MFVVLLSSLGVINRLILESDAHSEIASRRGSAIEQDPKRREVATRVATHAPEVAARMATWCTLVSTLTILLGLLLVTRAASAASPEAVSAVRDLGADHDRATEAVYRLQRGGGDAAEAVRDLWPSLSPLAKKRAVRALQSLAAEFDPAVDTLVDAARAHDETLRDLALDALRSSGSRGRRGLVVLLSDPEVGERAANRLARSDPDLAIEPLLDALAAPGGADRRGVRSALVSAVQRAGHPRSTLESWLRAEPARSAVASASVGLSTLPAHTDVLTAFIEYALPASNDFATAWRLLESATAAGPSNSIDRWVRRQLHEPEPWMLRAAAVRAVAARGKREQARVALSDPYPRVRAEAATALAGDPTSVVVRARLARKDPWPIVRAAAVVSLRAEERGVPIIVASVDDSMSVVRAAAIEALAGSPHDRGWDRIHARLRSNEEWPSVTEAAIGYVVAHCRADAAETLFRVVMRAGSSQALTEDLNSAALAVEALRSLRTSEADAFVAELRRTPDVPTTLKIALDRPIPDDRLCRRRDR